MYIYIYTYKHVYIYVFRYICDTYIQVYVNIQHPNPKNPERRSADRVCVPGEVPRGARHGAHLGRPLQAPQPPAPGPITDYRTY